jgi:transcriptional antiterminator RfaH
VPSGAAEQSWFVAKTQPRRERWAAENCARQGAECYLPFTIERNVVVNGRLLSSRLKPLFPGYLFIRTLVGQWHFLRGTFGIADLIRNGDTPSTISNDIIEDLRLRESEGAVELPDAPLYAENDPVRIIEGPFQGFKGLVSGYSGNERVKVLLELMGRKVNTLFGEGQLEAI